MKKRRKKRTEMRDKKRKVVILIGALLGGGAERVTCDLANYLSEHDVQTEILTMSEETPAYVLNPTIKVSSLLSAEEKASFLCNNIKRYFRLKKYLKHSDADCFVAMLSVSMILLLLMKKHIQGKLICAERSNPDIHPKWQKVLLKRLLRRADGFVAQTPNALSYYEKDLGCARRIIIPNAVSQQFFDITWKPERKEIVAVGRLSEVKNHKFLLKAFSIIADDFPEYEIVIYGDGPLQNELMQTAEQLGIDDRIRFPGWLENIGNEISKAFVYVLTSNSEGMPNSLIEAMAIGMPVIATDCPSGGPASLIDDGVNGFLVPINGERILADKIRCILLNPKLARELAKAAKQSTYELISENIYGKWHQFILSTIGFKINVGKS